jgi:hypothetical protein
MTVNGMILLDAKTSGLLQKAHERIRTLMPRTGLPARLVVQHLADVEGRLRIAQRAVEGSGPPGRQRDQCAPLAAVHCSNAFMNARPVP